MGRLFEENGADDEVVQASSMGGTAEERKGAMGRYGPADKQVDTGGHQAAEKGVYYDYKVVVKKSCDDGDPDADRYVVIPISFSFESTITN